MKKAYYLLLVSILSNPVHSAPLSKSGLATLLCDMTRVPDKEILKFSLAFNESEKTMHLNGLPVGHPIFTAIQISGKDRAEDATIPGVSRELSVLLDRVSGKLSVMTLPVATDGGEFTEWQKEKITSRKFDPIFIGQCVPTKPMF
jgi:hypothetical protein